MTDVKKNSLSTDVRAKIDHWLQRYPADQKRSGVIQALRFTQEANNGSLTTELMDAVADYLSLPRVSVYEVASFYMMFHLKPVGKHVINVCTNISCMLCGCDKIVDHFKKRLGVGFGETTPDGKFTLLEAECLAACTNAPMALIDKTYHENLTPEKIDTILQGLE